MASTRERIIEACNGLQISSVPLDWTEQAWSCDFCESVDLPEVLENRILECKYCVDDLQTLLVTVRQWSTGL